ncbi:MAG: aldo/keto reductase [Desulfobacterales bacterium]|nr:aldo/keto reductase [Desulfobacterales bacterium]
MAERNFGKTGRRVTCVGLGGEGVLRTFGRQEDARSVIRAALDSGVGYYDSARVYSDSERYYGSVWGPAPGKRTGVFQASKSASRDFAGAMADLEQSLVRLRTDTLDLWQIHDVRTAADLAAIEGPGGALKAFVAARDAGTVRAIGVTGHHDPKILTEAVGRWPVDAVMMPVNPVEAVLGGFLTETLPAAREKGVAVIGMKVLGASHYILLKYGITASLLIRFALSQDIDVAIVGCGSVQEVQALAGTGRQPVPISANEQRRMVDVFAPYARKLAFYRGVV